MSSPSLPLKFRRRAWSVASGLAVVVALVSGGNTPAPVAQSTDPCAPPLGNAVKCENALTGNPSSEWDVSGVGDTTIQGFATDISVVPGGTVQFKVKTTASAYRLDIYRIGYYGGSGARKIATVNPSATLPQSQPNCMTQVSTGLVDCGNWAVSASWTVPATAVSGVYIARPRRTDTGGASHIIFVVRNDTSRTDLLFQTADTTWAAYNEYGGNSLYVGSPVGRAYKVSYNRPLTMRTPPTSSTEIVSNTRWRSSFWLAEYPLIRFLEANGYDLSYSSSLDSDRRGAELLEHKVFLSTGHDEYWSAAHRANVEAARDAGVNLAFFSANTSFWKTRWENSIAPGTQSYRTLVTYKETEEGQKTDPSGVWTGTWRDPRFSPPYDGGRPENALKGTLYMINCCQTASVKVSAAEGKRRFWRNTGLSSLAPGASSTFGTSTVGFEVDSDMENGFRPAGLFHLATNTITSNWYLLDYGSNYGPGTGNHSVTIYKHPSGALVFSSSSMQWAWGLDSTHDKPSGVSAPTDSRIRQATINILADMGTQPTTLLSGLVAATASTDQQAPTTTITYPTAGYQPGPNENVVITGTSVDTGGGVASAVEVSTDGGVSWDPASGTPDNWTFAWKAPASGSTTIAARSVDDSGNLQALPTAMTFSVAPVVCPCSFWNPATTTPTLAAVDRNPYEFGIRFKSSQAGRITGIRFYKDATNTGTHTGKLWSSSGTQLASVVFTNETGSGWQTAMFSSPVAVSANTTYVASYFSPVANASYTVDYFGTALTRGPLTAAADVNGVYREATTGFPNEVWEIANFWVDVIFETGTVTDTTPPTVTAVTPTTGSTGVATSTTLTATFSEALLASSVSSSTAILKTTSNQQVVTASVSYSSANQRITLTPSAALAASTSYTAQILGSSSGVKDAAGNALASDYTWSFTTAAAGSSDTTPPTVTAVTPTTGSTAVATSTTVTATFSEAMDAATITSTTVTLRNPSSQLITAAVSYSTANRRVTLTPSAALAAGTVYTARVVSGTSGVKDSAGNALATDYTWTFTTAGTVAVTCPCSFWDPATTTPTLSANDPNPYELGIRFSSSVAGKITGVRYYKGPTNTGTHTAKLWTSTGTLLAQATFTNETSTGWQTATFATPVSITANTTYVASYFAPVANSTYTINYFTAPVTKGPLTAPVNNGVYRDEGPSGFPLWEWEKANFWVDVIFITN